MASLDTNVLVRYLTKDDEHQYRTAKRFIEQSYSQFGLIFVPLTVILETEWVLRSRYKFDKNQIYQVFTRLLDIETLDIDTPTVLAFSLAFSLVLYQTHNADFADCLHTALSNHNQKQPFYSFDVNASDIAGNALLADNLLKSEFE